MINVIYRSCAVNHNFKQVITRVNKFEEISLLKKEFKKPLEGSEDWLLSFQHYERN